MKKILVIGLTAAMLMTSVLPALGATSKISSTSLFQQTPTSASSTLEDKTTKNIVLTQDQKKQLLNSLEAKGLLDGNPQLVDKINRGELPDSSNPEKIKAVAKELSISEQTPHKKYVFPDGSYLERTLTVNKKIAIVPENRSQLVEAIGNENDVDDLFAQVAEKQTKNQTSGKFSTQSLKTQSIINTDTASYYYDIWIQEDGNATGGGFTADFVIVWGGADSISKVWNPRCWAVGGTYTISTLAVDRPTEGIYSGSPARAHLSWEYSILGLGGSTYSTNLFVGNNTYYSTLS
ncbi:hypothetical protein [Desulfitobacterium metallireducens]|uniref:Uncharacterized protein n=1 Tax=Desulfitobacterium metallireducens DSM 15288 TaxID=871968 RepID=W0EH56_9FIRM|nr:hypothetical protein [Desulfitobacterium metallireducens]AHF08401.1 hypothetical protein DESME_01990 [Desulfitobacterium metallireducens DSM 15288]